MKQLLTQLFDVLLPPSEEVRHLRTVTANDIEASFQPQQYDWFIALSQYQNPAIAAAIRAHKFQTYGPAQAILIQIMNAWLKKRTGPLVLIPIPLHPTRERERGYNQVTTVLQKCEGSHKIIPALKRTVQTKPQTTLDKAARQANVKDAFVVTNHLRKILPGSRVVLVDDVVSTGATMNAARASLAPHLPPNCTLTCLAFAH